MGFFEDDRIRAKNRVHSEAFDMLTGMRDMGFSNDEIIQNVSAAIEHGNSDQFRMDVYNMMLHIIRSLNEKADTN